MNKLLIFLFLIAATPQIYAEPFDIGLGFSYIDAAQGDGFSGGWDLQLGYEFAHPEGWNIGGQIQATQGLTKKSDFVDQSDLAYSSTALYFTARPDNWWLYFKGGIVDADFQTLNDNQHTAGVGAGAGIVYNLNGFRVHLLDYQRVIVGNKSFNIYTISITLLDGVFQLK